MHHVEALLGIAKAESVLELRVALLSHSQQKKIRSVHFMSETNFISQDLATVVADAFQQLLDLGDET